MEIENGLVVGTSGINGANGQNGTAGGDAFGGAILDNSNSVSLVLSNCWITESTAQGGQGGQGRRKSHRRRLCARLRRQWRGGHRWRSLCHGRRDHRQMHARFNNADGGNGGNGGANANTTSAPGGPGGNGGFAAGGGIFDTSPDTVSFTNATFTANYATGGAGGNGGNAVTTPGGPGGGGGPAQGGGMSISMGSFFCDTIYTNSTFGGIGGLGGFGAPPGPKGRRRWNRRGHLCFRHIRVFIPDWEHCSCRQLFQWHVLQLFYGLHRRRI